MRYGLVCLLIVVGLMAGCGPAGSDGPNGWDSLRAGKRAIEERYYSLSNANKKLGWGKGRRVEGPNGEICIEYDLYILPDETAKAALFQKGFSMLLRHEYDKDMSLRRNRMIRVIEGDYSYQEFLVSDQFLTIMPPAGSSRKPVQLDIPESFGDEIQACATLLKSVTSPTKVVPLDMMSYSFSQAEFTKISVSHIGESAFQIGTVSVPGNEFRVESETGVSSMLIDDEMMFLTAKLGNALQIERIAKPDKVGSRLASVGSLSADRTIQVYPMIESMELEVQVEGDSEHATPLFESGLYHDVERTSKGYMLRTIRTKGPGFFNDAPKRPLTEIPEDVQRYLLPTATCESDNPIAISLSEEELKDRDCSFLCGIRLISWTTDNIAPLPSKNAPLSAIEVIAAKQGDLCERVRVLVTLSRAAGIPARSAAGYKYQTKEGKSEWIEHRWAEIWMGRWVAFDFTPFSYGQKGRYILIGYDEPLLDDFEARQARAESITSIKILGVAPGDVE